MNHPPSLLDVRCSIYSDGYKWLGNAMKWKIDKFKLNLVEYLKNVQNSHIQSDSFTIQRIRNVNIHYIRTKFTVWVMSYIILSFFLRGNLKNIKSHSKNREFGMRTHFRNIIVHKNYYNTHTYLTLHQLNLWLKPCQKVITLSIGVLIIIFLFCVHLIDGSGGC